MLGRQPRRASSAATKNSHAAPVSALSIERSLKERSHGIRSATSVLVGPGHRVDILVRAPQSGRRILKTLAFNQGRLIFGEDVLATIEVEGEPAPDMPLPGAERNPAAVPEHPGPEADVDVQHRSP